MNRLIPFFGVLSLGFLVGCSSSSIPHPCSNCLPPPKPEFLYASGGNEVLAFTIDTNTGKLTGPLTVSGPNASLGIAASPSANFLYASDFGANAVYAFSIATSTGALTKISGSPFAAGNAPGGGGLAIDPTGRLLYMAQINSNSVAAFTVNSTTGALTKVAGSPFPASANPMHLAVDPSGKFLFVSNTNDPQGGISVYTINAGGALTPVVGSPFPTQAFAGPSGLAVHPSGKFLYVGLAGTSNPNHFVATFSINATSGALTPLAGSPTSTGQDPLYVALDPSGQFLYTSNVLDSTISGFTVDANSGALTEVTGSPFSVTPLNGIVVDPAGKFLYAAGSSPITPVSTVLAEITTFSIDASTGALSSVNTLQTGSSDGTQLLTIVQTK